MIGPDDIEAFSEDNAPAIAAASEYARRAAKGLPADRLADGARGAMLVAKGIHAYQVIMAIQTDALAVMGQELQDRGTDAMRLHSKDTPPKV